MGTYIGIYGAYVYLNTLFALFWRCGQITVDTLCLHKSACNHWDHWAPLGPLGLWAHGTIGLIGHIIEAIGPIGPWAHWDHGPMSGSR